MAWLHATAVFIWHFDLSLSSVTVTFPDGSANYAGACPLTEFCTSPSTKNATDPTKISCCQKCSCSPGCYDVGTCCPDMPNMDLRQPKYVCKDLINFSRYSPSAFPGKLGISFRVIDNCLNTTLSLQYPRCANETYLDDFIFVSDLANEIIYRNQQYALCNGVTQFIRWKARVSKCSGLYLTAFLTIEERNQYVMDNCVVTSVQPAAAIGTMSRFIEDERLQLSTYCKYSTLNETIQRLCEENIPTTSTLYIHKTE